MRLAALSVVMLGCAVSATASEQMAAAEATALLGKVGFQAMLPVMKLENDLRSAKEGVACLASGTMDCPFKSTFQYPERIIDGMHGFTQFLEKLPKVTETSANDSIVRLRFDVFRPVVNQLMGHGKAASFVEVNSRLKGCVDEAETSAHKLKCEVAAFAHLMRSAAVDKTSLAQMSEGFVETEGIMEHALVEIQKLRSEVTAMRSKGKTIEKGVIKKMFSGLQEKFEKFNQTRIREEASKDAKTIDPFWKHDSEHSEKLAMSEDHSKDGQAGNRTKGACYETYISTYKATGKLPALRDPKCHMPDPSSDIVASFPVYQATDMPGKNGPGGQYAYEKAAAFDQIEMPLGLGTPAAGRIHYWHAINGLTLYLEDTAKYHPKAKCVDGTNPRAYYSSAIPGKEDNFHIYLEGGYFCFDTASCIRRCTSYKEHCSTYYWWEKGIKVSGLFNPYKNYKMAGWHHTYGGYCSSDAWLGKAQLADFDPFSGPKPGTTSFFRGQYNMRALLKMNMEKGLGTRPGQLLVMSGASAGGIGMTNTIDWFSTILGSELGAQYLPTVIGILDAAVLVLGARTTNTEWGGPPKVTFEEQTKRAWYNLGINYLYPPQMKTSLPLTGIAKEYAYAPWRLLLGEFRIPLVTSPAVHLTTIDDDFALAVTVSHAHAPPFSPKQEIYFEDYRSRMFRVLEKVDVQSPRAGGYYSAVFAFRCFWHCLIENESLFTFRISTTVEDSQMGNVALMDVINFVLEKKNNVFAVDRCEYFDCSCMTSIPVPQFSPLAGTPQMETWADPMKYMKLGMDKEHSMFEKMAKEAKKKSKEEKELDKLGEVVAGDVR